MVIPTHQPSAVQVSAPTGWPVDRSRSVSTIAVTGWFSANTRTGVGMVVVGTNAELMNGRKINGYAKAEAPSLVFALRPGMTASQVSARVNRARMPTTASQAARPALDRNPISSATNTMITTEIAL